MGQSGTARAGTVSSRSRCARRSGRAGVGRALQRPVDAVRRARRRSRTYGCSSGSAACPAGRSGTGSSGCPRPGPAVSARRKCNASPGSGPGGGRCGRTGPGSSDGRTGCPWARPSSDSSRAGSLTGPAAAAELASVVDERRPASSPLLHERLHPPRGAAVDRSGQ